MTGADQDEHRKQELAQRLDESRSRTWILLEGLSDIQMREPVARYLSPPNWDVGHMANFEELWLVQQLDRCAEMRAGYNSKYNALEHPRHERPKLQLLDKTGLQDYMAAVRRRTLELLQACCLSEIKLTRDGFVHEMLVMHEAQHQETLLQSFCMRGLAGGYRPPAARTLPTPGPARDAWCHVPTGPFDMGWPHVTGHYDNESPIHTVGVNAFDIARYPVTNGQFVAFIDDDGYHDGRHWSARGQEWLHESGHDLPEHWHRRGGTIWRRTLRDDAPVYHVPDEILCHISYFEAEAYAAWSGARLPTEAEWEKAARFDHATQRTRELPWGPGPATDALCNIDHLGLGPSQRGAFPEGASPCGAEHMIGDVWEWTSTRFDEYPGFEAFPYDEYSKTFFGGDYRVLRGGSWAARAGGSNATFRNWDHPYRRQIFAGIRLARDPPQ
jgi:iron(II)-dependent oxidoreductase